MTLVKVARRLWLARRAVTIAFVCSCLLGILIAFRVGFPPSLTSRQYQVGVASASALVDTSKSTVADANAGDVLTLATRAALLGSLMANPPIKDDIARLAGIPANKLGATPPATVGPAVSPAPSVSNAPVSPSARLANTLTISIVQGGQLPIVQVDAQAPTAARAARLANASLEALVADVNSVASSDQVPALQRLIVRPLGPAASTLSARGIGPLYGLIGTVAAFFLACVGILGVPRVKAAWRTAAELEEVDRTGAAAPTTVEAVDPILAALERHGTHPGAASGGSVAAARKREAAAADRAFQHGNTRGLWTARRHSEPT